MSSRLLHRFVHGPMPRRVYTYGTEPSSGVVQKVRRRFRQEIEHFIDFFHTASDAVDLGQIAATTPCCVCGRKVGADEAFAVEGDAEGRRVLYCAEHMPDKNYFEPPE